MATNIARFIGGPLDGTTIRCDQWPPPNEWICPDNAGGVLQHYLLQGSLFDADETVASHPNPVRYASFTHEGDWPGVQ